MKLLSVQEVAKILGCGESTVRTNAKKGTFGFRVVKVGSLWKFPSNEVYKYLYGDGWEKHVPEPEMI